MEKNTVSCYLLFTGSVQGVGFRYTACRIARPLGLRGFVRNLPGGEVEACLEGEREKIGLFISGIQDSMRGNISGVDTQWGGATGKYTGFRVRF